jgi:hypothetical protein
MIEVGRRRFESTSARATILAGGKNPETGQEEGRLWITLHGETPARGWFTGVTDAVSQPPLCLIPQLKLAPSRQPFLNDKRRY